MLRFAEKPDDIFITILRARNWDTLKTPSRIPIFLKSPTHYLHATSLPLWPSEIERLKRKQSSNAPRPTPSPLADSTATVSHVETGSANVLLRSMTALR